MKNVMISNIVVLSVFAASVSAATHLVPGNYPTIQAAMDEGNDGDTIVVSQGIYCENVDFKGKDITLTSMDPEDSEITAATIIDANGVGSVVTFASGEGPDAVIQGFTITGGQGTLDNTQGVAVYWGAGIYCRGSSPTIKANIIRGNRGPMGMDNGGFGGGASAYGARTGEEGVETEGYGYGGGICCENSSAVIDRNIIFDNAAFFGAGIMTSTSECIITNNLIYENSGVVGGGAAILHGGRLTNNTFAGNSAANGGTIYAASEIEMGRCLITNNIVANSPDGHGIYWDSEEEYADTVRYNDFWNNAAGDYYSHRIAKPTSNGANIFEDPLFVDAQADDYHLQGDSPCVDSGDPDFAPPQDAVDIDGDPRLYAARVDVGADEYVGYVRPAANAGCDQYLDEIQPVVLDGGGSYFHDPNGTRIFHWTQTGGPAVELSSADAMQTTFMPPSENEYRFELVVSDGLNSSLADDILIVVGNRPPVADAGSNITVEAGGKVYLDGTGSYDPDPGDELTYGWKQVQGPSIVLHDGDTPRPFFDCSEEGIYTFELTVSDGFDESGPSAVQITTVSLRTKQQEELVITIKKYQHCGDVRGSKVVYAEGGACPLTWTIDCLDLETGEVVEFNAYKIDTDPKVDGELVVWFAGDDYPPKAVFARNVTTGKQVALRQSWSAAYIHPAISGSKVVWVEHPNVNPADPAAISPFGICGADISDLDNPTYFTVAENVGSRLVKYNYGYDFDDLIDISGNIVVWEAQGDIYAADITDTNNISVFEVCTDPGRQYDASVSGNIVVWTDERDDGGDIYGADLEDPENVRVFEIVKEQGPQKDPSVDGRSIVYVDVDDGIYAGTLRVCCLTRNYGVVDIALTGSPRGVGPAIDGDIVIWQSDYYGGKAAGISLEYAYSTFDGPVENAAAGRKYDFIQHAVNDAEQGATIVADEGVYHENVRFKGRNVTVRSREPRNGSVVAGTIIDGRGGAGVSFAKDRSLDGLLSGFTITGGLRGVYCNSSNAAVSNCVIAENGTGVYCFGAQPTSDYPTFTNCVIAGNRNDGVYSHGSSPALANCTIAQNLGKGIYCYFCRRTTTVTNSIIWANSGEQIALHYAPISVTYSDVQGGWGGVGNIDADPLFGQSGGHNSGNYCDPADALCAAADYHLQSQAGRWDGEQNTWVSDAATSRCIDAGNPGAALAEEPGEADNKRVNMGAFGGTVQASRSPAGWSVLGDLTNDGCVDFADFAHAAGMVGSRENAAAGDLDRSGLVDMADVALFVEDWLETTAWHN